MRRTLLILVELAIITLLFLTITVTVLAFIIPPWHLLASGIFFITTLILGYALSVFRNIKKNDNTK